MSEQTEHNEGGLAGLGGMAGLGDMGGLVDKAKDFLTDERIDMIADKLKAVAPDSIDAKIDALAEKAKEANG